MPRKNTNPAPDALRSQTSKKMPCKSVAPPPKSWPPPANPRNTHNQQKPMKTDTVIDINKVSYEDSKKYQWKAIEPMQRKGDQWSQRCECKKTGAKGIRRGFFL
jgi:hypothetical protein